MTKDAETFEKGARDQAIARCKELGFSPDASGIIRISGFEDGANWARKYMQAEIDCLRDVLEKAIPEIQWITNGLKLNPNQHVRIGDLIVLMHEALKEYRGEK